MTELQIQAAICRYLQSQGIFFHSVPNEAAGRNRISHMQLISAGLRAGVADLVVWLPRGISYIEVKTEKGRQSDRQKAFEQICKAHGVFYAVVRSVEDIAQLI